MHLSDKDISDFLAWIADEVDWEILHPGTTICRELRTEIIKQRAEEGYETPTETLKDLMCLNICEEFMDRAFDKALSNLRMYPEYHRIDHRDLLLQLPIICIGPMLNVKQKKRRMHLYKQNRTFEQFMQILRNP